MYPRKFQIILLFYFLHIAVFGQTKSSDELIRGTLRYIEKQQICQTENHLDSQFNGLWPSSISNVKNSLLFGKKGKSALDANCFVSCLVHNLLAELYLEYDNLDQIPPMLRKSLPAINSFQEGSGYNFFPIMDVPLKLAKNDLRSNYPNGIRRASHFEYPSKFILKGFNIYNDSDDTGLAFYANYLSHQIDPLFADLRDTNSEELASFLEQYRDTESTAINFWNRLRGYKRHTGAYLTWLPDDPVLRRHNFLPSKGEKYIPYGVNDIDCVVNANLLGVFAATDVEMSLGMKDAANWVLTSLEYPKCRTCAVYYPTGNVLYYCVLKAFCRGAELLSPGIPIIREQLLASQMEEGCWHDDLTGNQIQATLYAVNTLLRIVKCGGLDYSDDIRLTESISAGMEYLLLNINYEEENVFLKSGVVFSAGSVFKRIHVWKSDVWATALFLESLLFYYEN